MENYEIIGEIKLKSGDFEKEIVESLVNRGFAVAKFCALVIMCIIKF